VCKKIEMADLAPPLRLSVIIPAYNAQATLGDQLRALATQSHSQPWELIIADNGSTDGTVAVAESFRSRFRNFRIVDASGGKGAAYARNTGAACALSDALAFCDADDVVAEGWLEAIAGGIEKHGFVASRFDLTRLNSAWVSSTFKSPQDIDVQRYKNPPFLPHAGGSGLGIKKQFHDTVGGFDTTMRCLEDTDYCWRLQMQGITLYFASDAVVHVRYRTRYRAILVQMRAWGKANVRLYQKYRRKGMPAYDWKNGVRFWLTAIRQLPKIRSKDVLKLWWCRVNWRFGRLLGCLAYGVFAP
jgi:glycosyltransferase involved in cell wall biosynthesis